MALVIYGNESRRNGFIRRGGGQLCGVARHGRNVQSVGVVDFANTKRGEHAENRIKGRRTLRKLKVRVHARMNRGTQNVEAPHIDHSAAASASLARGFADVSGELWAPVAKNLHLGQRLQHFAPEHA